MPKEGLVAGNPCGKEPGEAQETIRESERREGDSFGSVSKSQEKKLKVTWPK